MTKLLHTYKFTQEEFSILSDNGLTTNQPHHYFTIQLNGDEWVVKEYEIRKDDK